MKLLTIKAALECPSDWTEKQVRKFLEGQLLSTEKERKSLEVREWPKTNGEDATGVR